MVSCAAGPHCTDAVGRPRGRHMFLIIHFVYIIYFVSHGYPSQVRTAQTQLGALEAEQRRYTEGMATVDAQYRRILDTLEYVQDISHYTFCFLSIHFVYQPSTLSTVASWTRSSTSRIFLIIHFVS